MRLLFTIAVLLSEGLANAGSIECDVAGDVGFLIAESSDAVAIGKWMQAWNDLLSFDITPVLRDKEVTEVIG